MAVAFSGNAPIQWFERTVHHEVVTATFVNPNSFATYAGIGLLCATAVLWYRFRPGLPGAAGLRLRLRYVLAEFMPRNTLFLIMWLVLASALLLSLSRGGVAATALSLMVFFWVLAARRGVRTRTIVLGSVGPALAGATLFLLVGEGLERRVWDTGPDWLKRAEIYAPTLGAIEESPLLGTGLGTFAAVYRSHRSEEIRPGVNMAHNDYLELMLELGTPAAVLLVCSIAVLALGCALGVRARRREAALPAVGVAACTLVGAHALVDFSLQIPAVAVTFALVLGVSVSQAPKYPSRAAGTRSTLTSPPNTGCLRACDDRPAPLRARYKRPLDLAIVVLAGIVFAPLWLLLCAAIPAAIWLEDRGRILHVQTRLGLAGRPFEMVKFRSMVERAEDATGPVWAAENDARFTKVGRVLRPLHLDELPNVLNVLKGDMSLVGPRPERPEIARMLGRKLPAFSQRLCVRPGIAGLAQARRRRVTARHKLRYDRLYIAKMSPVLDLKLLAACVLVAIRNVPLVWQPGSASRASRTDPAPDPPAADRSGTRP